jgi:enamine deaminase RidA (YjgF/YER057c/UK114 family)
MSEYIKGIQHINPEGLHKNPAFTQVISVTGPAKTIYVGGQNAVDAHGNIVGKGDLATQVAQVYTNLQKALQAAGADVEHVVKWNLYIMQGESLQVGFQAFLRLYGIRENPPTITSFFVAGLANPDFLLEMDATAVIPLA